MKSYLFSSSGPEVEASAQDNRTEAERAAAVANYAELLKEGRRIFEAGSYRHEGPKGGRTYYTHHCGRCGKRFENRYRSYVFCSDQCRTQTQPKRDHHRRVTPWADRNCAECSTLFSPKSSRHRCCSPECGKLQDNRRRWTVAPKRRHLEAAS